MSRELPAGHNRGAAGGQHYRKTFPTNSQAAAVAEDAEEKSPAEEVSQRLTEALTNAGFVREKVQMHFQLTALLEEMWSGYRFAFSGNFTEGWGYNLFSVCGRPGLDSSVTYQFAMPNVTVHASDCKCPDRGSLTYEILPNGAVHLSKASVPVLSQMGLLKANGIYQLQAAQYAKVAMSRSSTNPQVEFLESLLCCRHQTQQLAAAWPLPPDWLRPVSQGRVYVRPKPLSFASGRQLEAELDFSELERKVFAQLSDAMGQLYMSLKYLLLEALPPLLPRRCRPLREPHCRHLLLHSLARLLRQPRDCLAADLASCLKLLEEFLLRRKEPTVVMPNFFCQSLLLRFPDEASDDVVEKRKLVKALNQLKEKQLLPSLLQYRDLLQPATSSFEFRPLLMTVSGKCGVRRRVQRLADYPSVGFGIYRALDLLLEPRRPTPDDKEDLEDMLADLRPMANSAAACLQALLVLKMDQGPGLAHQMLVRIGEISVADGFEFSTGVLHEALLKRDCAWLFRGKFSKLEPAKSSNRLEPDGTAYLEKCPLIRGIFFPTRRALVSPVQTVRFDYSLRVNFAALLHLLRVQLNSEWGTAMPPEPQLRPAARVEAQELLVRAMLKRQSVEHLQQLYRQLKESAAPFHRLRGSSEWRWAQCVRLRLLGLWVQRLVEVRDWQRQQIDDCCELYAFVKEDAENFLSEADGLGRLIRLGHVPQANAWLRAFFETELEGTFPKSEGQNQLLLRLYDFGKSGG